MMANLFGMLAVASLSETQRHQLELLALEPPIRGLGRYELTTTIEANRHLKNDPLLTFRREVKEVVKQGGFCTTQSFCQRFLEKDISREDYRRRRRLAIGLMKEARPKAGSDEKGFRGRTGDVAKANILKGVLLGAVPAVSNDVRDEMLRRVDALAQVTLRSPVYLVNLLLANIFHPEQPKSRLDPAFSAFSIDYEDAGVAGARKYLSGHVDLTPTETRRHDRFKWQSAHNGRRSLKTAEAISNWQRNCGPKDWWGADGKTPPITDERTLGDMDITAWQSAEHPFSREIPYADISAEIRQANAELKQTLEINQHNLDIYDQKELEGRRAAAVRANKLKVAAAQMRVKAFLEDDRWSEVRYYIELLESAYRGEIIEAANRVCLKYAGLPHVLWNGQPKAFKAATESLLGDCSEESLFRMRQFCEECYYSLPPWLRCFVQIDAEVSARLFLEKPEEDQEEYVEPPREGTIWLYADVHPKRELAPFSVPDYNCVIAEYEDGGQLRLENGEWVFQRPRMDPC